MHDLIIVGGGPAGSSCARRAALHGLDVVLLEKSIHPRDKLCGGGLTPRIKDLVDFDISAAIERDIYAARLISPSGRRTYLKRDTQAGYTVKRAKFDQLLLKKAEEAGARVEQGTEVVAVEQLQSGIRVLSKGDSYRAPLLVAADGVNGIVARSLGIRKRWPSDRVGLCIAADVPVEPGEIERIMSVSEEEDCLPIEIFFGPVEWGYAWCFPKQDELSIGIGCRMDRMSNLKESWRDFVSMLERTRGIQIDPESRKAFRVPIGGCEKRVLGRRTMLIGDAAGLVSPISGEGIYYAIESGLIAADITKDATESRNPHLVRKYQDIIKTSICGELSAAMFIANIMYKSSSNIELICKIIEADPVVGELMIDIVAASKPMQQLRIALIKRLVTRHPLKALRLGL
ncbi:MAG: NAD(P)/FAD-dependent oxidoreductase [Candidatus Thorarchaeota archaeon]